MFTGIIEEIGTLQNIKKGLNSAVLTIGSNLILTDIHVGDSIAVNGICLTVTDFQKNNFTADVMHETLNRSSLYYLKNGSSLNLERAMAANGRFGGHMVSGHIDGIGKITSIEKDDNSIWYRIKAPDNILKFTVEKGSIAIDGISLTIADITANDFSVSVIPHTVNHTILGDKTIGDFVNLETDMVGKYVKKFLFNSESHKKEDIITKEFLIKFGY